MSTPHRGPSRRTVLQAGASAAASVLLPSVQAQSPSDKTVKIILPNATGSGVDAITRAVQPALSRALGHPVVVENQPGAGGIVGVKAITQGAPDGFTLGIVSNNVVIFPSVYRSLPFDLITDVTPIAICGYTPIVLVVNPKVPATTAREFVAWLKARDGDATYASGGNGTILHLTAEMFVDEVGAMARHIPYKGVGPMVTDLIGGQVEFGTAALPSVQPHIKSGALRAIGIGTAHRIAAAPDIPTFVEQGVPNYVVEAWFAALGPKGLPAAEGRRVHAALTAAFADPTVKDAMNRQGNVINVGSTEHAQAFFRSEMLKYAKLVKKAGIESQ